MLFLNMSYQLLGILIQLIILGCAACLRITGDWNSEEQRFIIATKFGFQRVDPLNIEQSRGFIFGNVTSLSNTSDTSGRAVLLAVPQTMIANFLDVTNRRSCGTLLSNISALAFEARCLSNGKGDLMRWIPCNREVLCVEEDDFDKVISGSQMTFRIEEPSTPQYWYIVMVGCYLDNNCRWQSTSTPLHVHYDLWLTNGKPETIYATLSGHQFSFDEQNSPEMYLSFLLLYIVLAICQWRSVKLAARREMLPRHKLLTGIITLKTCGLALQCLNVVIFSLDGKGIFVARLIGEMIRLLSVCLLCLLLLLLGSGWSFIHGYDPAKASFIVFVWSLITAADYFLFIMNFFFVDDILHDIDIYKSWAGYGMISLRVLQALWFLSEIRKIIRREIDEAKAIFLAHFGAGFLVWFVYVVGLGVMASFVSALWRFRIILAITTLANYTAITCLVHLFWPTSPNYRFFQADAGRHRRLYLTDEAEDFESLLLSEKVRTNSDSSVSDDALFATT